MPNQEYSIISAKFSCMNAKRALEESKSCLKGNSIRAAYIFAYLSLLLELKTRILSSEKPPGMMDNRWSEILEKIRSDESWENATFDATQQTNEKTVVFDVPHSIRVAMPYWRTLRNNCAHAKSTSVKKCDLESFLSFVQATEPRWFPLGGVQKILDSVKIHFDPTYTQPGADISPLINLVSKCLPPTQTDFFLDSIYPKIKNDFDYTYLTSISNWWAFFDGILKHSRDDLKRASTLWILRKSHALSSLLRRYPEHVKLLKGHETIIRMLWRKNGGQMINQLVLAKMIEQELIPKIQEEEAIRTFIRAGNSTSPSRDWESETLIRTTFWEIFKEEILLKLHEHDYRFLNRQSSSIIWYIKNNTINHTIASSIERTLKRSYPPFDLRISFHSLIKNNIEKRNEIEAIQKKHREIRLLDIADADPLDW